MPQRETNTKTNIGVNNNETMLSEQKYQIYFIIIKRNVNTKVFLIYIFILKSLKTVAPIIY